MLTTDLLSAVIPAQTARIYLAYSGGLDSHVLLHLAETSCFKSKLTAVYVHHDLQQEADSWAQHCQMVCDRLHVDFICLQVQAKHSPRQSPEEAARDARYSALKSLLKQNEMLLLAQHREDQLETVLLQLFRGAGVQGLSAMPLKHDFGFGQICRPFLEQPKQAILDYAHEHELQWVEDPSNQDSNFDRNFLRNGVIPLIKQRWPSVDKTVARSARHCANSQLMTGYLSSDLFAQVFDESDKSLRIDHLLSMRSELQSLLIRQWFAMLQLKMPSEKILLKIVNEMMLANPAANPQIIGKGYCLRRYRNKLYCLLQQQQINRAQESIWPHTQTEYSLQHGRKLILQESDKGIDKHIWDNAVVIVKYRSGAEKIRLPGRRGHHRLKKLFQEQAIPPWERENKPLIYLDGKLAVVAGLWISDDFYSINNNACYQVCISEQQ